MKIVNRKIFLKLPAGVLFSKYVPCIFDDLCIKGDTSGENDFWAQPIAGAVACNDTDEFIDVLNAAESGSRFALDFECEYRDGLFDADQLFAVWELQDVIALISRLQKLLLYYPEVGDCEKGDL